MSTKNVQDVRKAMGKPLAKTTGSRVKKKGGITQPRTPQQRVLVLKEGRRKVLEWRPWS